MDLQSGAIALVVLLVVFAFFIARNGLRTIRSARKMTFYHLRRQREAVGQRLLGLALLLVLLAVALPVYGLPMAYEYFPPSPTPSPSPTITVVPTITLTPTITLSPTITDTPLVSDTPTASATPYVPAAILARFSSSVTPGPDVVFSPIDFTTAGSGYPAVRPDTVFQNPVGHLYGIFTYDGMLPGVQWTNLWFRAGTLVYAFTAPWDGATGGSGFVDWHPSPDQWAPGIYLVQIFVGEEYVGSGRFLVQGNPPTLTPSATPKSTLAPSATPIPPETAAASLLAPTIPSSLPPSATNGTATP
jgi:type VI secretion system secreted protein VgrG